ncbi:hypothetical protein BCR41DRAFT_319427, partial [Lobosporangium transversale]
KNYKQQHSKKKVKKKNKKGFIFTSYSWTEKVKRTLFNIFTYYTQHTYTRITTTYSNTIQKQIQYTFIPPLNIFTQYLHNVLSIHIIYNLLYFYTHYIYIHSYTSAIKSHSNA